MNHNLKVILLWLLITALPIQGLAAVVKSACGPVHHSTMSIAAAATDHDHHHDGAGMHSAADSASADAPMAAEQSFGTLTTSFCSACAACCIGAVAPPPAAIVPALHSSSKTVLVPPAPLVAGYIPDGLKRPPKHVSA